MVDLLLYSLAIKSSIRDYEVFFSQSIFDTLDSELQPDDVIIIDENVFNNLQSEVQKFITNGKHIIINATEEQKNYTALTPIIENILVNAVSPGFTRTELTEQSLSPVEIKSLSKQIPVGRFAEPSEIAQTVLFLCSEMNTYITGQNIVVDGGFTIV